MLAARTVDECAGFLPGASFASWHAGLGLTYTQASIVLVLAAPGGMLGSVSGILADHRSRRVIAAGGAFGYALSVAAFGAGHTFVALACASFATGFCAHTLISGTEVALVHVAGADVNAYFARSMLFGTAGGVLGPAVLLGTDAAGFGWRGAFLLTAAVLAAYGAFIACQPLPPPDRTDETPALRAGLRTVVRDRRIWFLGLLALLMGTLQQPFTAFVVAYATDTRGASPAVVTLVAASWIVGVVVAATGASRLRAQPARIVRLRTGAAAICAGAACAAFVPSTAALAVGVAAAGFGASVLTLAIKRRLVGMHPGLVGSAFALVSIVEFAGFALPVAVGRVADAHGVHAGLACFVGFAFVLLLLAIAGDRRERRLAQASKARAI